MAGAGAGRVVRTEPGNSYLSASDHPTHARISLKFLIEISRLDLTFRSCLSIYLSKLDRGGCITAAMAARENTLG